MPCGADRPKARPQILGVMTGRPVTGAKGTAQVEDIAGERRVAKHLDTDTII